MNGAVELVKAGKICVGGRILCVVVENVMASSAEG